MTVVIKSIFGYLFHIFFSIFYFKKKLNSSTQSKTPCQSQKNVAFLKAEALTRNLGFLDGGDFKTMGKRDGDDRKSRELGISSMGKT